MASVVCSLVPLIMISLIATCSSNFAEEYWDCNLARDIAVYLDRLDEIESTILSKVLQRNVKRGQDSCKSCDCKFGKDGMPGFPGDLGDVGVKGVRGLTADLGDEGLPCGPPPAARAPLTIRGDPGEAGGPGEKGYSGDSGECLCDPARRDDMRIHYDDYGWCSHCPRLVFGLKGQPGFSGAPGPRGEKGDRGFKGLTMYRVEYEENIEKGDMEHNLQEPDEPQFGPIPHKPIDWA